MLDLPELSRVVGPDLDLGRLLAAASADRHRFVARTLTEWRTGANRFDQPGEGFFLAHEGGEIVGMCGLNIDPYANNPAVGRIRHLYVLPLTRRSGVGTLLVAECLDLAAGVFDRVRLRTFEPTAAAFYTTIGFQESAEEYATHEIALTDAS